MKRIGVLRFILHKLAAMFVVLPVFLRAGEKVGADDQKN
jgi:hypothetical protein